MDLISLAFLKKLGQILHQRMDLNKGGHAYNTDGSTDLKKLNAIFLIPYRAFSYIPVLVRKTVLPLKLSTSSLSVSMNFNVLGVNGV
jgi:hypothetical protein